MLQALHNTATYFSLFAITLLSIPANAGFSPSVSGEIIIELQNKYTADSDDKATEHNNLFLRTEIAPTINLTKEIFIDGVLVFEPFTQTFSKNIDNDIYFDSNGLFAEEVKLNYAHDDYTIWAGKFNPSFGSAWAARGIWGEDFAEDYEITEKIGIGASYTLINEQAGNHTISASTFFADTSFLNRSTITKRSNTKKSDGGSSNNEDFSSFALSLDGKNIAGIKNLSYQLALRHLAQGDADIGTDFDNEKGFAVNTHYITPVSENIKLDALGEYVNIQNFAGIKDIDHQYITISMQAIYQENWNLTLSYTDRNIDAIGHDYDDSLFQVSAGYDFANGLTTEIGYKALEAAEIDSNILGLLVRYNKKF